MISISIDDKACVSCSLCVDECPTDVFAFDESKGLPEVVAAAECFGCLSCSELCPAGAIEHEGVYRSQNHYHDPYALGLVSKLACDTAEHYSDSCDSESRRKALNDLGVRLLSMAEVFRRTLGGSLPAVGTMAGRTLARHLPRHRSPESLDEALELACSQFAPAWQVEPATEGDKLTVAVKDCFVREVCQREGLALGGDLCTLFYNYLAGYVSSLGGKRLRLMGTEHGTETCVYDIKIYG